MLRKTVIANQRFLDNSAINRFSTIVRLNPSTLQLESKDWFVNSRRKDMMDHLGRMGPEPQLNAGMVAFRSHPAEPMAYHKQYFGPDTVLPSPYRTVNGVSDPVMPQFAALRAKSPYAEPYAAPESVATSYKFCTDNRLGSADFCSLYAQPSPGFKNLLLRE